LFCQLIQRLADDFELSLDGRVNDLRLLVGLKIQSGDESFDSVGGPIDIPEIGA